MRSIEVGDYEGGAAIQEIRALSVTVADNLQDWYLSAEFDSLASLYYRFDFIFEGSSPMHS